MQTVQSSVKQLARDIKTSIFVSSTPTCVDIQIHNDKFKKVKSIKNAFNVFFRMHEFENLKQKKIKICQFNIC